MTADSHPYLSHNQRLRETAGRMRTTACVRARRTEMQQQDGGTATQGTEVARRQGRIMSRQRCPDSRPLFRPPTTTSPTMTLTCGRCSPSQRPLARRNRRRFVLRRGLRRWSLLRGSRRRSRKSLVNVRPRRSFGNGRPLPATTPTALFDVDGPHLFKAFSCFDRFLFRSTSSSLFLVLRKALRWPSASVKRSPYASFFPGKQVLLRSSHSFTSAQLPGRPSDPGKGPSPCISPQSSAPSRPSWSLRSQPMPASCKSQEPTASWASAMASRVHFLSLCKPHI